MTEWLALWGALLSTFLGALKALEVWKGRFRIDVGCMLTSSSELGKHGDDKELGQQASPSWNTGSCCGRSGRWPRRTESVFDSPGEYATDIHIAPGSSCPLQFVGPDHFDWGVRALRGRRIFIPASRCR